MQVDDESGLEYYLWAEKVVTKKVGRKVMEGTSGTREITAGDHATIKSVLGRLQWDVKLKASEQKCLMDKGELPPAAKAKINKANDAMLKALQKASPLFESMKSCVTDKTSLKDASGKLQTSMKVTCPDCHAMSRTQQRTHM